LTAAGGHRYEAAKERDFASERGPQILDTGTVGQLALFLVAPDRVSEGGEVKKPHLHEGKSMRFRCFGRASKKALTSD